MSCYFSNAQITLKIEASRTSGTSPLYVFFDASGTSGLSANNDLDNTDFSSKFDMQHRDSNGVWQTTKGMVSGHVLETPGTYEVSCTVTAPDGSTDTENVTITVTAFNGTTYYISNEGDDNNDGLSIESPWEIAQCAFEQWSANEQICFRRGDTFTGITQNLNNRTGGPMIIASYGAGSKPILSGHDDVVVDIRNSTVIRVMDIHIVPIGTGYTEGLSAEESENILALRLEIEQTSLRPFYQDNGNLSGVFDCNLHDFGVMSIYSGSSSRLSFVGNELDNLLGAHQPEHAMRIQGGEKQFIT